MNSGNALFYLTGYFFASRSEKPSDGRRNAPNAYGVMSVLKKKEHSLLRYVDEQNIICEFKERQNTMTLFIAGLLGLIAVAFGAYADHGLAKTASAADLKSIATALKYHQLHAVALMALGLSCIASAKIAGSRFITYASLAFFCGILFFSFSIYTSVLLSIPALKNLAPIGGSLFMLGWLCLGLAGLQFSKQQA